MPRIKWKVIGFTDKYARRVFNTQELHFKRPALGCLFTFPKVASATVFLPKPEEQRGRRRNPYIKKKPAEIKIKSLNAKDSETSSEHKLGRQKDSETLSEHKLGRPLSNVGRRDALLKLFPPPPKDNYLAAKSSSLNELMVQLLLKRKFA